MLRGHPLGSPNAAKHKFMIEKADITDNLILYAFGRDQGTGLIAVSKPETSEAEETP